MKFHSYIFALNTINKLKRIKLKHFCGKFMLKNILTNDFHIQHFQYVLTTFYAKFEMKIIKTYTHTK